jgi:crotonobetainyl-CoA:carnitine CoA-transferase CaiB-like acyl-CoA transferase
MAQVYADEQLQARNFLVSLPGLARDGAPVRVPGLPLKATAMTWRLRNPAPRLAEHNQEILGNSHRSARAGGRVGSG